MIALWYSPNIGRAGTTNCNWSAILWWQDKAATSCNRKIAD